MHFHGRPSLRALLLLLMTGLGPSAWADPGTPDETTALVRQVQLPEFERRASAATARAEAAEAWFAGQGRLEAAWPELADAPLTNRTYLSGLAGELDARAVARIEERAKAPPAGLSEADAQAWRAARDQACAAEDLADGLQRRLVAAARATLTAAPELAESQTSAQRARLRLSLESARTTLSESPDDAEAKARAAAAGEALSALTAYERAALRALALPDPVGITEMARADLDAALRPPPTSGVPALREAARADRLQRARPLLPPEMGAEISSLQSSMGEAKLRSELVELQQRAADLETRAPEPPGSVEVEQAAVDAATSALDKAKGARAALPEGGDPQAALRLQKADEEIHVAQLQLQRANARLELAEQAQLAIEGARSADDAEGLAKAEQAKADELKSASDDPAVASTQDLREGIAKMHEEAAALLSTEAKRQRASLAEMEALRAALKVALDASTEARRTAPVAFSNREALLEKAWTDLEGVEDTLRDRLDAAVKAFATQRQRHHAAMDALAKDSKAAANQDLSRELVEQRQQAESSLVSAHETLLANAELEATTLLSWLGSTRDERRRLEDMLGGAPAVPKGAPAATDVPGGVGKRDTLSGELRQELRELSDRTRFQALASEGALRDPRQLFDLEAFLTWLLGSLELVVLGLLWVWSRRRVEGWVGVGLRQLKRSERMLGDAELRALREPLAKLGRDVLDVVAAGVLLVALPEDLHLLYLLTLIWLSRELIEAGPLAVHTALATPEERRASLRLVPAQLRELLERSVRTLLMLGMATWVLHTFTLDLLDLDRSAQLLMQLARIALVGLGLYLLHAWAPIVQLAVGLNPDRNMVTDWVTTEAQGPTSQLLRSLVGVSVLIARSLGGLFAQATDEDRSLSWLGAIWARRSLKAEPDAPSADLPAADAKRLREAARTSPEHVEALDALMGAFTAWKDEGRMGLVAVVGDWGSGKSDLLGQLEARLEGQVRVRRPCAPPNLNDVHHALRWLGESCGVGIAGQTADSEALVQALREAEPTAWLVDDMHQLFLRTVGGYGALRAVLNIMQVTSDRHLWVTTYHGPTWAYLELLASRMGLDAYRCTVKVAPLSSDRLGQWLTERTHQAGLDPRYEGLIRANRLGGDPALALQRTRSAYFRLLTDAAQGNPHVALEYWLSSLTPVEDLDPEDGLMPVEVRLFTPPSAETLEQLSDHELFVLTGLVIHDGLPTEALSDVLNLPLGRVRACCDRLQALRIVRPDPVNSLNLSASWRPVVLRHLRQKHFLRRGVA
ncbi:MAG: hypothetical protein H6740_27570 [Alphaproteobacteria bacterium]|nr:hypothetical protein [Alphaproteobacteria bacterium]